MSLQLVVEAIARKLSEVLCHDPDDWELQAGTARSVLIAIAEQGYAVVPREGYQDMCETLQAVDDRDDIAQVALSQEPAP